MSIKKAKYVAMNIQQNQEFHFTSEVTKLQINDVYNSSWFRSTLYNIYSTEKVKLESSCNRNENMLMDLPFETHHYLKDNIYARH